MACLWHINNYFTITIFPYISTIFCKACYFKFSFLEFNAISKSTLIIRMSNFCWRADTVVIIAYFLTSAATKPYTNTIFRTFQVWLHFTTTTRNFWECWLVTFNKVLKSLGIEITSFAIVCFKQIRFALC